MVDDDGEPTEPSLKIIEINLSGVILTSKLAVHYMTRQDETFDRCLILKASIMGYLDTTGSPTYSAAKHGLRAVLKALRRRTDVRVALIAPW